MSTPHVSIVLATIRPDLVPQALEGIAGQTLRQGIEVILVHDGGAPIDPGPQPFPVRSVGLRPRLGPSAVRNAAMAWAEGDVIAFCDDDDLWEANHLEKVVPAAESGGLGYTDAILENVVDGWTEPFRFHFRPGVLRRTNPIILSTAAVDRAVLRQVGGFDASFDRYEAWDWFLRIEEAGLPIIRVPEVTVRYRYSPRSVTADTDAMAEAFQRFRTKHALGEIEQANFAGMVHGDAWADLRDPG